LPVLRRVPCGTPPFLNIRSGTVNASKSCQGDFLFTIVHLAAIFVKNRPDPSQPGFFFNRDSSCHQPSSYRTQQHRGLKIHLYDSRHFEIFSILNAVSPPF
jgi:hypothetical protein